MSKISSDSEINSNEKSGFKKVIGNILIFFPIVLSLLLLGAHFNKAGWLPLVIFCVILPFLLFIKRVWVARLVQIVLVLGAIEWIRITIVIVGERIDAGDDWIRLVIILGGVALFTLFSGLLFPWSKTLQRIYVLNN